MEEPRETYGRYCLPVYEDPPLILHPVYLRAAVAWMYAYSFLMVCHAGLIHVGHSLDSFLYVMFIATMTAIPIHMIWDKGSPWRLPRPHRKGGSNAVWHRSDCRLQGNS